MAEYYKYIYIVSIAIISWFVFKKYKNINYDYEYPIDVADFRKAFFVCILFVIFIGTRPNDICFGDMRVYYEVITSRIFRFPLFDTTTENLIYDNLINYWAYKEWDATAFFTLIATIYFGGILYTCRKLFPGRELMAFLVCIAAFSTFSYSTNGIKAGAAASIFLVALSYYNNLKIAIPIMLISWGFHHSMSMPIAAFACVMLWRKPKYYFVFWFACLILCAAHITYFQELLSNYTDESGKDYLTSTGNDWNGKAGFRLDFILYSSMPVIVGWVATYRLKFENKMYETFMCMYLLTNGLWMVCMYINFNNRVAYLSWFMYPLLLLLPSIDIKWKQTGYPSVAMIASLHLLFTLGMTFIYY